jgi:hypothetical protein
MNLMFIKNGGKGKGTFHKWSRQMSFKKSSSKVEGERPSSGVARKARGKGFGMVACQSVVRARKRIQNPPRQRRQNVIAQTVGWEKPDPIHWMAITVGEFTHCHLR